MEASALNHSTGAGLPALAGRSPLLRLQSDERLVVLTRRGQQGAFETLIQRYRRACWPSAVTWSGPEDAEDILQEVFAASFNAIFADDRRSTFARGSTGSRATARLNHLRRPRPTGQDSMDVFERDGGVTTADRVHKREEFRQNVRRQDLPETQRTALMLREIDDLSYDQIAEAMDTSIPSVKSLLVRARVSLAEAAESRLLSCDEVRLELGQWPRGCADHGAGPPPPQELRALPHVPGRAAPGQSRPGRDVPARPARHHQEVRDGEGSADGRRGPRASGRTGPAAAAVGGPAAGRRCRGGRGAPERAASCPRAGPALWPPRPPPDWPPPRWSPQASPRCGASRSPAATPEPAAQIAAAAGPAGPARRRPPSVAAAAKPEPHRGRGQGRAGGRGRRHGRRAASAETDRARRPPARHRRSRTARRRGADVPAGLPSSSKEDVDPVALGRVEPNELGARRGPASGAAGSEPPPPWRSPSAGARPQRLSPPAASAGTAARSAGMPLTAG